MTLLCNLVEPHWPHDECPGTEWRLVLERRTCPAWCCPYVPDPVCATDGCAHDEGSHLADGRCFACAHQTRIENPTPRCLEYTPPRRIA